MSFKVIEIARKINLKRIEKNKLTKKYKFEDRKQDKEKVCFILAGYKDFLYDTVFARIKRYIPSDIEVCIVSSGKYDEKLSNIAKENNWSYLSTEINNVCLAQNVAINLFEKSKYIYKIDEDIFITENYFETMFQTLKDGEENSIYKIAFVAPTIPINGFSHYLVLERFGLLDYYEKTFEKPIYASGKDRMIEKSPEVAKFFWGEGEKLPNIDEMNKIMSKDKFDYVPCPIRFSIGAILFRREIWEQMGKFYVDSSAGMGMDEEQLCSYCTLTSRTIIVSKNTVARTPIVWQPK